MDLVEKCYQLLSDSTNELFKLSVFKSDSKTGYKLKQEKYEQLKGSVLREFESTDKKQNLTALEKIRRLYQLGVSENKDPAHFELTINNSVLIYSCAIFDFYLSKLTEYLYRFESRILATSKKTITYEKLFTEPIEEIKSEIIEKEVHELSYKRIDERILLLSNRFELDIEFVDSPTTYFTGKINKALLVNSFAYRNLILHNRGIVNRIFLETVEGEEYKLGETLEIKDDFLDEVVMTLVRSSTNIFRQIELRYWQ